MKKKNPGRVYESVRCQMSVSGVVLGETNTNIALAQAK